MEAVPCSRPSLPGRWRPLRRARGRSALLLRAVGVAAALAGLAGCVEVGAFVSPPWASKAGSGGVVGHRPGLAAQEVVTARAASKADSDAGEAEPVAEKKAEAKEGNWFEKTAEFWDSLELWTYSIEEDEAPEAKALVAQNKVVEEMQKEQDEVIARKSYMRGKANEQLGRELDKIPGLVIDYWKMRVSRVLGKESVKEGFVSFLTYGNLLFIFIFLRTFLPRLLLVESMDDFAGLASELGIPSRAALQESLQGFQAYDTLPKLALFTGAFVLEKLTFISEILPVQIGLKTVAPLLFGGLIPGALASATCETVGALVNFFLGRQFLTERLQEFSFFGGDPLGQAPWFGRLQKASEKEGLKLTLLLRLARVLPGLPLDSYWYILGALKVSPLEFTAAHWLGCLKTSFLDASLGVLLLSAASIDVGQKDQLIAAETAAFAIVAFLVQTFATGLVKDILGLEEDDQAGDSGRKATAQSADGASGGRDEPAATSEVKGLKEAA